MEIELWIKLTTRGTDTIFIILRLPASQTNGEKCTYISSGLGNLTIAAEPISEDFEGYLLARLVDELNNLFLMGLATELICDRHMDSEVFEESHMDRTALILIGASHLAQHWMVRRPGVSEGFRPYNSGLEDLQ